jgi:tRNA threonylcarbamoyl adenosine modification protein (Sua5/YciO/YrdC/YwlC family)
MKYIDINIHHPNPKKIEEVVKILQDGKVIAIPTDTCYALACVPNIKSAVEKLVQIRNLDPKKPRALIFSGIEQVSRYTLLSKSNFKILKNHLPGPYCFVLESNHELPKFIGDKRNHIGIRIPNHPIILEIVSALNIPLTVTSAVSLEDDSILKNVWEVEQAFGHQLEAIVDCGEEVETLDFSSVIDLTGDEINIIREGLGDISAFIQR